MSPRPSIAMRLSCGCWTRAALSRKADALECPHGHGWQTIVGYYSKEWRAACLHCSVSSWHGQSEPDAKHARTQHQNRKPTHRVEVKYVDVTTPGPRERRKVLQDVTEADTLPLVTEEPPPPF